MLGQNAESQVVQKSDIGAFNLESYGAVVQNAGGDALPVDAQRAFVGRVAQQVRGKQDIVGGEGLPVVPGDIVFQMESIERFIIWNFIAFGEIRNNFPLAVIFQKSAINQLDQIFVGVIGLGNYGIDMRRLADGTLDIFSAVIGDGRGFGIVKNRSPAEEGSN